MCPKDHVLLLCLLYIFIFNSELLKPLKIKMELNDDEMLIYK